MRISDWSSDVCSSDLEPAHALVDLREDIGLGRIERVVEVEYPRIDMVERKRGGSGWHGGRPSACAARRQSRIYLAGVNQFRRELVSDRKSTRLNSSH